MTTDNTMIDCYEVVPGLGIQKVRVLKTDFVRNDRLGHTIDWARDRVNQKPRVAPRTAVAVPVVEVGNPISEAVGRCKYRSAIDRVIARVVASKKAGGAA